MFNKISLVNIAKHYVKLKKINSDYAYTKCKCGGIMLFNCKESHFTCLQCSAGGSVLEWVSHQFDVDIQEAYKWLHKNWGLYETNTIVCADTKKIAQLNNDALRFFETALHRPVGKKALNYLKEKRHLSDETIAQFHMGCAVDSWDALKQHLLEAGYSETEMLNAGLLNRSSKTLKTYDFFMDRAMFPFICDDQVVGFGGRTLCNDSRKYLNSKKTLLFQKQDFLFGWNLVKQHNHSSVLICEGNLDVISLHQAKFTNAVATCGTALSSSHISLLQRNGIKTVYLCFDADLAGQTAIIKAIGRARDANTDLKIRVICIPQEIAKDPDEFLQVKGADEFYELIHNAISAEEFLVRDALRHNDVHSITGKQNLLTTLYGYGLRARDFISFLP